MRAGLCCWWFRSSGQMVVFWLVWCELALCAPRRAPPLTRPGAKVSAGMGPLTSEPGALSGHLLAFPSLSSSCGRGRLYAERLARGAPPGGGGPAANRCAWSAGRPAGRTALAEGGRERESASVAARSLGRPANKQAVQFGEAGVHLAERPALQQRRPWLID